MPVIRADRYAVSPADTPHSVLLWGVIPLDSRTRVAQVLEYRMDCPIPLWTSASNMPGAERAALSTRAGPGVYRVK